MYHPDTINQIRPSLPTSRLQSTAVKALLVSLANASEALRNVGLALWQWLHPGNQTKTNPSHKRVKWVTTKACDKNEKESQLSGKSLWLIKYDSKPILMKGSKPLAPNPIPLSTSITPNLIDGYIIRADWQNSFLGPHFMFRNPQAYVQGRVWELR